MNKKSLGALLFGCIPLALILALTPLPLQPAQSLTGYSPAKGYVCYQTMQPIRIDGRLDEDAWKLAPWSDAFVDIEGDRRPKPQFKTRMKMLWDKDHLYIAAELEEPHIWATYKQHDSVIFHEPDFEVFIDPDGDNHLYAELELNALNTTWDLLLPKPYKDGGRALNGWEIIGLRTAVHVDGTINDPRDQDRGWTVEIAWPWEGLKELTARPVPPRDGDQWRINFSRVEWKYEIVEGKYRKIPKTPEDNWVWSPQGVINMHQPEHWGYVQFSTAKPGTVAFQPDSAGKTRHFLHQVYYAQIAYRKKYKQWAKSLSALGLAGVRDQSFDNPRLQTTDHNFEAAVDHLLPTGKRQRWFITADSKITHD